MKSLLCTFCADEILKFMRGGCFGARDELKKLSRGVVGAAFPACSFVQRLPVQIIGFEQVFFCKLYNYVLSSCNDGKE